MQATVDISRAQSIGGWMSDRELLWLATAAKDAMYIAEFGCFHGRSTRALADNMPEAGMLWAVDPWNGEYYLDSSNSKVNLVNTYALPFFKENLKDHIDAGRVIVSRGWSYKFTPPFPLDMVFIDGDHRPEIVRKDIRNAMAILRLDGLICGHDYRHPMWPGVKEVVDDVFNKHIQTEETIWWTRKY